MLDDLMLALESLEAGKYEDAESFSLKVLLIDPNNRFALQIAAMSSRILGAAEKATELWHRSLLTPLPSLPSATELDIILRIGDLTERFGHKTYLSVNPEALAYANMGAELAKLGDIQSASDLFMKAIQIDPDCELAYYNRGVMAYNTRNIPLAIASMKEVLRVNPANRKAQEALRKLQR
jgi:tetratricopeptide (TPR) repeat protein